MKIALILALVLIFSGCGGKKVKKETSQEYLHFTQAYRVIDEIRVAYLSQDSEGIRKNTSEATYAQIVSAIKSFEKAELEFTPVLVEIQGDKTKLHVSWNGKWSLGGKELEHRGLASFVLKGNPPKLERILRGNPFRVPE